ncbi:diadenosine tetraphosphate hydrolase [Patescibacteria group bacterium]|nr:diadenosine tetraphosphate hydrolase [Patescibacteria group bacterium]
MEEQFFPNEKIIVTDYFDIHQDWEVPIPGFFIVASIKNRVSLDEFDEKEANEFLYLTRKLRKGMKDVLGIKTVCLYQDEGSRHGFHLWIFPRYEWMNKFGNKVESIRPIINHAKENMVNDEVFLEVKDIVKKMRDYMK